MSQKKDSLGLSSLDYTRLTYVQKIRNFLMNRLGCIIHCTLFGYYNAKSLWKARKYGRIKWLSECCRILEEEFSEVIDRYRALDEITSNKSFNPNNVNKVVWFCWLQGEEQMPAVVRLCLRSIKKNIPSDCHVEFVSAQNLREYIQIPEYIYHKLRRGKIQINHFTDIVRFMLLKQYGGIWIDATVFLSSKIPESYFELPLYSIQSLSKIERDDNIYYGALTSFLIGGQSENFLFSFIVDFFLEYQKRYNWLIDVHWINLAYAIAYKNFNIVREQVDRIHVNNSNRAKLDSIANDIFDQHEWDNLLEFQIFHKFNWRKEYQCEISGRKTYYGHLMQLYL